MLKIVFQSRRLWRYGSVTFAALLCVGINHSALGHVYVLPGGRAGAYPSYEGAGWFVKAFLNIPDADATDLIDAENYIAVRKPDFTFRTPWIDFPAGETATDFDTNFATIGDFLDDYIEEVSDSSKLDAPFGNFLLRFTGYIRVVLPDDTRDSFLPPIWIDLGCMGHDGYRVKIGGAEWSTTIYRIKDTSISGPFFHDNPILEAFGLYPVEITYFNQYDATGALFSPYAGIELYGWYEGGLPWPSGKHMIHPTRGIATIVPPRIIYQADDLLDIVLGDFEADYDIDLFDAQWFQYCFTGPPPDGGFVAMAAGCTAFDFDLDEDVDLDDLVALQSVLHGPQVDPDGGVIPEN